MQRFEQGTDFLSSGDVIEACMNRRVPKRFCGALNTGDPVAQREINEAVTFAKVIRTVCCQAIVDDAKARVNGGQSFFSYDGFIAFASAISVRIKKRFNAGSSSSVK